MRAIAIGFHDVVEDPRLARPVAPGHTTLYTLGLNRFREHLEAIRGRAGSSACSTVSSLRRLDGSNPIPVLLTFDDGTAGCHDLAAPELETLGWHGHFFVTTGWTGRPGFLSRSGISSLHRRGHVVGSHSATHPERMSALSWQQLMDEWKQSCGTLSDIIGEAVVAASVPGGYCSSRVCRAAAACGIRFLFTSQPSTSISIVDGCMILGRYPIRRSTTPVVCGAIAAGARIPRLREAACWLAAGAVKRVFGGFYPKARRLILAAGHAQPGPASEE